MNRILLYQQIICHFKDDQQDESRLSIRLVLIILIYISDAIVTAINDLLFLASSLVANLFVSSFMTPLMACTKRTLVAEGEFVFVLSEANNVSSFFRTLGLERVLKIYESGEPALNYFGFKLKGSL